MCTNKQEFKLIWVRAEGSLAFWLAVQEKDAKYGQIGPKFHLRQAK
jgi:hypothetical protein